MGWDCRAMEEPIGVSHNRLLVELLRIIRTLAKEVLLTETKSNPIQKRRTLL